MAPPDTVLSQACLMQAAARCALYLASTLQFPYNLQSSRHPDKSWLSGQKLCLHRVSPDLGAIGIAVRSIWPSRLHTTHLQPFPLLRQKHALAVTGGSVPVLGRGCAEIIEDENPQRRGQRAVRRLSPARAQRPALFIIVMPIQRRTYSTSGESSVIRSR
jgi:hypothetical protein